jgi:hypothetical protein
MGRGAIQAEGRRDKHAINITTPHIFPIFGVLPQEIRAGMYWDGGVEARGMADVGNEAVKKASGERCLKCSLTSIGPISG